MAPRCSWKTGLFLCSTCRYKQHFHLHISITLERKDYKENHDLQDEKALEKIKSCYFKYNFHDRDKQAERSLCALEMRSFMFAALDSATCIRRSMSSLNFNSNVFCDPLGDKNIHWPLGPMSADVKSVVMVVAKLDANSMYENLMPGAGSTVTGLVTLLAAATYLHSLNATVKGKL